VFQLKQARISLTLPGEVLGGVLLLHLPPILAPHGEI
jgi:hypothetical protein